MEFSGIVDFFKFLLNSEDIINYGGLALIVLIVYAENGFFFAFFLPGDYLLFLAGLFCSTGQLDFPITTVSSTIFAAAVLGTYTGYFFGKLLGKNLENKKDTMFFKKKHMERSRVFFNKYGGKALIIARFMPIVRTFSPIIAGTIRMNFRVFSFYNILGGIIWSATLTIAGYYLGQRFPGIINYVHYIILFFISITSMALIRTIIQLRRKGVKEDPTAE